MKKIEKYINKYDVSKTLRFRAIPVGATQDNINTKLIIENDELRAENFKKAKEIIDRYHQVFISRVLKDIRLKNTKEYANLFFKLNKSDDEKEKMIKLEDKLRAEISEALQQDKEYKKIMGNDIINKILPEYLTDETELEIINSFKGFYTAFTGYSNNRKNVYVKDKIKSSIGYRCIHENLPKFLSNIKIFETVNCIFKNENLEELRQYAGIGIFEIKDLFCVDYFDFVLTQAGIDLYNAVIGGGVTEDGKMIKGINVYINLYNQANNTKYPLMKPLYKQILTKSERISFYEEKIKNDEEALSLFRMTIGYDGEVYKAIEELKKILNFLKESDKGGIYFTNGIAITTLSNDIYGSWKTIQDNWNKKYDEVNRKKEPKDIEKYEKNRRNAYKKIESFSIHEITELDNNEIDFIETFKQKINEKYKLIKENYEKTDYILNENYKGEKQLKRDKKAIEDIKNLLDSIKNFEKYLKPMIGSQKEENRDEYFYGKFIDSYDKLKMIDEVYDKIRNYVTSKPYSKDKFKLYFDEAEFMNGWTRTKEEKYQASVLRYQNNYYLAIMDKEHKKCMMDIKEDSNGENYEKMDYYFTGDLSKQIPRIFFSKDFVDKNGISEEIINIYNRGSFSKNNEGVEFNLEDCHKLIDYYKKSLQNYAWNEEFKFKFSDTKEYKDLSDFYKEINEQAYKLSFVNISKKAVDDMVENGMVYMFQIYCKDFSESSHGNENLHTKYFKLLFEEKYHDKIRMSGGAEFFYRKASIKKEELVVHKANEKIDNKNPDNPKRQSVFDYDIFKDRRYSVNQFELHLPIKLNSCPQKGSKINESLRKDLKNDENPYVIGIDRGERNLIYMCVIDGKGNIVEQFSLNEILNQTNGITIKTDYHKLLHEKENGRQKARQSWSQIENIKELKEGYISQVVHKICELVEKYDAVIAMEDLNSGFKKSRIKVEKQVYQKFEKMLTTKLNYMSDKNKEYDEHGSVVNAYQLTNKVSNSSGKIKGNQDGFIFYIPAWLTSKIDPSTGFVNLINTKYKNIEESKLFVSCFENILYDQDRDMFMFEVDYSKFPRTNADYVKKWNIYTNGERIENFRNEKKNSEWDYRIVDLTKEFKELFDKFNIDYKTDLQAQICEQNSKDFFRDFLKLLSLTLQMRNSISGTEVDYLISPVLNKKNVFFDSRQFERNDYASLPKDADANGAYNIARKVLWAIEKMKNTEDEKLKNLKIAISNKEWLEYAQTHIAEF